MSTPAKKQKVDDFEKREEERKARDVRMIHRQLGTDIQFRSTEHITNMLDTAQLGGMPVKFFIISAHGSISRKNVFRMPPRMAVFDLAENEYRGRSVCECLEQPLLDTIIGRNGDHMGSFFNAMLGGEYEPNPTSPMIPQIGYRTPGELAFDILLNIYEEEEENDFFEKALGCWDITPTISTFNPTDFTHLNGEKGYITPNKAREIANLEDGIYWPETILSYRMRREKGLYLSEAIRELERKYPGTVCFVIVSCCMGINSPELPNTTYPEQPAAYTHYAVKGKALGDPPVGLIPSMKCRDLDDYVIDYGINKGLSMVLRSSNYTQCSRPANSYDS